MDVATAQTTARRLPWALIVGSVVVTGFIAVMKLKFFPYPIIDGDTTLLVSGAHQLTTCLWRGAESCPNIWHFPLLQYLIAIPLYRQSMTPPEVMKFYSLVSAISFVATLLLGAGFLWWRGRRGAAVFFLLAVISSFAIWHFNATYGESAGGLLIAAFVVAALWRRSAVLIGLLAVAAAVTKETTAPFLLAVGVVPLLRETGPWGARLKNDAKHLAAMFVGAGLGVAANTAFNQYRFGAWTNTFLLDPGLQVPSLPQHLFHLAGIWFSPNGGLLPYAPLLTVALVGLGIAGWKAKGTQRLAAVAPLALLVVLTIGFARWFSPFGWWTWGPRLCLPWLPALLIVALDLEGERLERAAARVLRPLALGVGLAALLVAASLPHVQMLRDPGAFYGFFSPGRDCPQLVDVRGPTQAQFYVCHNALIFPRYTFMAATAYGHLNQPESQAPLLLYMALLLGLWCWLRVEVLRVPVVAAT